MKKSRKVNLLLSICLLLIMGFTFVVSACKPSGYVDNSSGTSSDSSSGGTTQVTIGLSESSVQMIVGEYKKLNVSYSKIVDGLALEWSSENDTIAIVKGGEVEAISEGTTKIKAKYGNATASCDVTVSFGSASPQLKLGTANSFGIALGDEYTFSPKVLFNGRKFTDGQFVYTSSDPTVLTMQDNVLKAKKVGKAQVFIEGSWRGKTVSDAPALQTVVDVEITDAIKISLVGNAQDSTDTITLYSQAEFEGVTYKNTESFEPEVYKNGEVVTNAEYEVLNLRPDVVTYNPQTKRITAIAYGEAVLTVQTTIDGKTHSKTFTVVVLRPEKTIASAIKYFSTYKGTLKNESTLQEQTVIEHILGNTDEDIVDAYQDGVALKVSNNRIFGVKNNSTESYETILTVGTATTTYHVTATVYGMYITEPSDLEVFVLNENKKVLDFYVELGKDINARGYTLPASNFLITKARESSGFTGVFEGNGYEIKGLTLQNDQGLFGAATSALIKNVAFTNWQYVDGYAKSSGILGVNLEKVRLSNVYVRMSELPKYAYGANVLASYKISGGSFKCVYVEYTEEIGEVSYENCYSVFGAINPNDEPTFENCFVVSQAPISVCNWEGGALQVGVATNVSSDISREIAENIKQGFATANNKALDTVNVYTMSFKGVRQYATVTDMQKDFQNTGSMLNAFSSEYWTVSENRLLWGKDNAGALEQGTIRLDLGIVSGNYVEGVTSLEIKAEVGATVTLPTNLKCMGYVFKGWEYLGETIENGTIENYDGRAMTVVAVWEKASNVIQTPMI